MLHFDEDGLIGALGKLSSSAQIAFAAAAATRQLGSYERLHRDTRSQKRPREIAVELWVAIQASKFDPPAWSTRLEEVMGLLPEVESTWALSDALAEDAISSLAYAIRCLLKPEPQEAAWAARRAYEAADQAAIHLLGVQPGLPSSEAAVLSHQLVQRELSRQRDDLSLLRSGALEDVKRKSFNDELLSGTQTD